MLVKVKGIVTVKAGFHIVNTWHTDWSVLVHNVGKGIYCSLFACAYSFVLKFNVFLVVKIRIALVAVQCLFIRWSDFPDYDRNTAVFVFFNG